MDLIGAPQRGRRRLRHSQELDLALLHQLLHGADGIFDRNFGIHAVLVVKIDHFHAQPLQAGIAALAHVIRLAAHADPATFRRAQVPKLSGQHHSVAPIANGAADKLLVVAHAVGVGGIEEGDTNVAIQGAMNHADRFFIVARAVELAHSHAAQADGGDSETLA